MCDHNDNFRLDELLGLWTLILLLSGEDRYLHHCDSHSPNIVTLERETNFKDITRLQPK